jgi:hypothetical protein
MWEGLWLIYCGIESSRVGGSGNELEGMASLLSIIPVKTAKTLKVVSLCLGNCKRANSKIPHSKENVIGEKEMHN